MFKKASSYIGLLTKVLIRKKSMSIQKLVLQGGSDLMNNMWQLFLVVFGGFIVVFASLIAFMHYMQFRDFCEIKKLENQSMINKFKMYMQSLKHQD